MSQQEEAEINGLDRKILLKWWRKVYRGKRHLNFTEICLKEGLRPNFCRIKDEFIRTKRLTTEEVKKIESRSISNAIKKHRFEIFSHESEFLKHAKTLRLNFSCQTSFENAIRKVKNEVFRTEMAEDIKKNRKLTRLKQSRTTSNFTVSNTVQIHNYSSYEIPEDVLTLLQLGPNLGVGGSDLSGSKVFTEMDKMFYSFKLKARELGVSEESIAIINAHSTLVGHDLKMATTYDSRVQKLRKFLKENPVVLLCVDKSKDLALLDKDAYHKKLGNLLLDDPNFEKVNDLSIKDEISNFNELRRNTMDQYLNADTIKSLECNHSISDFYGLLKRHKELLPRRPITTGFNSLVHNAEKYLANLLKPLLKDCKFIIDSPRAFKSKANLESFNYNPRIHSVVSYDCKSLYTRVKVSRVISWILDQVQKNPRRFFNETHNGVLLEPPVEQTYGNFYIVL